MHTKKIKSVVVSLLSAGLVFGSMSLLGFATSKNNSASAVNEVASINAYMSEDAITLNGSLSEPAWYIDQTLLAVTGEDAPTATVGYLWDTNKLYIGILQTNADTLELKVNGVQAIYNVTSNALTSNDLTAAVAKNGKAIEIVVPFSACNVTVDNFNVNIPVEIKLSNATGTVSTDTDNQVLLNGGSIYIADSCIDLASKGYTDVKSGVSTGAKQGDGSYVMSTLDTASTVGLRKFPTFPSGNLEYIFNLKINELPYINDYFAYRGFFFNAWGYLEEFGFSLTKSFDEKIYANILFGRYSGGGGYGWDPLAKQVPTSIQEGDTITVHLVYTGDKTNSGTSDIDVIINGDLIHTFNNVKCENPQWKQQFDFGVSNSNSKSGKADVEVLDFMVIRPAYQNAIQIANSLFNEKIPFEVFGGDNTKENRVMSDLDLPTSVKLPVFDSDVAVTWTSNRTDVLSNTGAILSRKATAEKVKLTASIVLGGKKYTHTYNIVVSGFDTNGKVMYLEDDLDPYTGVLLEKGNTDVVTFDNGINSIGYDQGSIKEFNEILLTDTDKLSRIEKEDLSIFVSDDNVTYTRLKDWLFFRTDAGILISNINATCRYVKVHGHLENPEFAGFSAPQQEMLKVYYNDSLVGNNGGTFTKLTTITSDIADKTDSDVLTYVSFDVLSAKFLNCRDDYADIRFVMGDKVLPHYFDGEGFYIRVLETVQGEEISIDVYGANENAISISAMEGVFDAVYGNKTAYKLQFDQFNHNIAVATAPNGDVLAIANWMASIDNLLLIRSTDGGRTWSDSYVPVLDMTNPVNNGRNEGGGFLLDPDANNGNGRLFYYYYMVVSGQTTYAHIIYTDDNGYTWSDPYVVNQTTSGKLWHASSYADGLKLSWADGDGPDVDYIFPAGSQVPGTHSFVCTAVYSKDNGKTWLISDSLIGYERGDEGYESGNSESAIAELPDGTLRTIMRCQYKGVYWYSTSYSTDHGVTWLEDSYLTNIAAPNTMPVLKNEPDGNITLMWGGNNFMGGSSYRRYPMTLAYSDDDMQTWKQKLNLFSQTSFEKYGDEAFGPDGSLIVQPSITFSDYQGSDSAYVSWWNFWYGDRGILIDDYHDMLYKTKGAADEFEINSSKYEGWVAVWGNAYITRDVAKTGNGSLRIDDIGERQRARVNRTIPALTKGSISFDIMFDKLDSGFLLELKSAFVDNSDFGNMISAKITPAGEIRDINPNNGEETSLGRVDISGWTNVTVNFDMPNFTAEILINGVKVGNLSVNTDTQWGTSITNVNLCDSGYAANQMIAYVDNFVAYNGIGLMSEKANAWSVA